MNDTRPTAKGISERNRARLDIMHRTISGPFRARDVANSLSLSIDRTQRFLAYLTAQGWINRVRRGLYITVPLGATDPALWREDIWIVASRMFSPFYIGGWSACEHWGLTEQIFRETLVVTTRRVRHRRVEIQGLPVRVKVVAAPKIFGTTPVWRGQTKIPVSDPSRTIIDILDDPGIGGGIRHVGDVLDTYFSSEHRRDDQLMHYARLLGNRAVFKRLGYLVEKLGTQATSVLDECTQEMSSGIALLDPSAPAKGRVLRRWNLRINVPISE